MRVGRVKSQVDVEKKSKEFFPTFETTTRMETNGKRE
jgi:hypothetical protein